MRNYFTYDGESSIDYGVYIGGQDTYGAPSRNRTFMKIDGRNGELIYDEGTYDNVPLTYHIVLLDEFKNNSKAFRNWLESKTGYKRLEDTYHEEYYRMAILDSNLDFDTKSLSRFGKAKLKFTCLPQRFLKVGEQAEIITSRKTLVNPTRFDSKPFIRVYGNNRCVLTVNGKAILIENVNGYVDIDCERMDVYRDETSMNAYTVLQDEEFPLLKPGENVVVNGQGITRCEIKGRWWEL